MSSDSDYKIKIGEYEGPLDLILSLIEKRKLCVNEISLAEITDGYINYLKNFEDFPLANGSDFLITASTLMLIKSLSLLPGISLTTEEKESIAELEERLRQYKEIKEKAVFIKENFGTKKILISGKKRNPEQNIFFIPTKEISVSSLLLTAKNLISFLPKKETIPSVKIKKVISLEEAMEKLAKRIQSGIKMKFSEFLIKTNNHKDASNREEQKTEKINIVIGFLAMLELIKRGAIQAKQEFHFGEIDLENNQITTPAYGV